jgi:hypothetical protein
MWYLGLKDNTPVGWSKEPTTGYIEVSQAVRDIHEVNPDYVWDGVTLSPPIIPEPTMQPPYTPQSITMRQCRLYLYAMDAGSTLTSINSYVLSQSPQAQIEWETSHEVWRASPMVEQLRLMFAWTTDQMDTMFRDASQL